MSKYFERCHEAKTVWDSVDNDIKDIIKVCLTHDISKRPFIRDITQMQAYQRLRNKM
jgi:predicted HD phosphohydrolase